MLVFPLVAISKYNMIHRRILSVETNVVEFFIFQRTSGPRFDIKIIFWPVVWVEDWAWFFQFQNFWFQF